MKWKDIIGHPGLGGGEFRKGWNVAVSDGDGERDVGVGEGFEDVRVGVEDLHAVDGGLGFEEVGHLGRRWEVVGDGAIVDADGVSGGGVAQ